MLCRTSDEDDRHRGLTQLIVDLRAPGVSVRPIAYLDGSEFFNEVVLDDVFVADDLVVGEVGAGWAQNTSELSFERAGPERWLSTYLVVEQYLREHGAAGRARAGRARRGGRRLVGDPRAVAVGRAPARRRRGARGGGRARQGARHAL